MTQPLRALSLAIVLPLLAPAARAGQPLAEAAPTVSTGAGFELIDPAALGFGPPSFTLDITGQSQLDYDDRDGGLEMIETRLTAPFARWNAGGILFGAALNYSWRHADFGGAYGLGEKDLHTVAARLSAFWRPDDSRWWVLGFVSPGVASDFNSVDSDAFTISGLALVGYAWSPRLDLAAGVFASYGVGETTVMGAVGFIWRPNDQWIIQATPPVVAIGWRPNADWTLGLVGYPAGDSWEVEETDRNVRQVDLSLWRAALSAERKIGAHWRVNVRGGVAFGGELELRDSDERVIADRDLDAAPFGAIALKWVF